MRQAERSCERATSVWSCTLCNCIALTYITHCAIALHIVQLHCIAHCTVMQSHTAQQRFLTNSQKWGVFSKAKNIIQTNILSINQEKKSSQVGLSKNFIPTNNRTIGELKTKGNLWLPTVPYHTILWLVCNGMATHTAKPYHTMVGMVWNSSPQPYHTMVSMVWLAPHSTIPYYG